MSRREFSRKTKRDAFARAKGHCECCGFKLGLDGRQHHFDHIKPTGWLEGDNSLENCQVLCDQCHTKKTGREAAEKAKSDRIRDKRVGAFAPRRKIQSPGFKKSPPQRTATRPLSRPLPDRKGV